MTPLSLSPAVGCLLGFLLGAIPFGLLIGKAHGIDLREKGSGNIGATNVRRALGKGPGLLVLLLDALKGYLPILLAREAGWDANWIVGVGFSSVLGHIYSPFMRFRGGKGVATTFGVLIGLDPRVAALALGAFILAVALTDYVSVGSLVAAVTQLSLFFVFGLPTPMRIFGVIVAVFVIVRHRANLQRLRRGEESHYRKKKTP